MTISSGKEIIYEIRREFIESDDEYSDGEQIEDLRNDIEMTVAHYNCFLQIGNVKVAEIG